MFTRFEQVFHRLGWKETHSSFLFVYNTRSALNPFSYFFSMLVEWSYCYC